MPQDGDFTYELYVPGNATITGYTGSGGAVVIPPTLGGNRTYEIGIAAFAATSYLLTSVVIPDSVSMIQEYAFIGGTMITSIVIGDGVSMIGHYAFYSCQSLTSITIPGGVSWIGNSTFSACYNLSSIIFTGMVAPSTVGSNWIQWTSANIKGYAYYESDFPRIGETFHGLLMGILTNFDIVQLNKRTRTYLFSPLYDIPLIDPCSNPPVYYYWQFGDGEESVEKLPTHSYPACSPFEVTLTMTHVGIEDSTTRDLDLTKLVAPNFEISGNYGLPPLTFHVTDTTDYECTGFYPTRWTWYIIYFGCLITRYGYGSSMNMTINVPGQYGLKMTVTDGSRTYSVTKRDIIFVEEVYESELSFDGSQIELAHESGIDNRRHLIKSMNNLTDSEKNSIQFYVWGTELYDFRLAENELMEVRGDDKLITKNLHPKSNLIYNIGSELLRWEELVGKDANILTFTEANILRLWSGK
jgi:PKD repeat protein